MSISTTVRVGIVGLVFGCAACSSSVTGSGSKVGQAAGQATHPASTGTTTTQAASSSTSTSAGQPQGGSGGASGWCAQLEAYGASVLNGSGKFTPATAKRAEQLAASAPSEIRADTILLVQTDEKVAAGQGAAADSPAVLKASEHVATWLQTHCPDVIKKLNP
jgi:hypothetical protein